MKQLPPSDTRNQYGFSAIEAVIVIFVLVALGLSGWFLWHRHQSSVASTSKSHAVSVAASKKPAAAASIPGQTTAGKTTGTTSGTQASTTCTSSDLQLSLGRVSNAAGTSYMDAILTNISGSSCTLNGYPTVQLGDGQGSPIGSPAANDTNAPVSTVTLGNNQTAHAVVGVPNPGFFSPTQCSANASYILVTPPDAMTALKATYSNQSCPGFSVTSITSGN